MSDLARALPWSRDEAELVTELQGGSGAAFDWLVTHYTGPVYSLVAGMTSESSDAADITQDVFLKAFRGIRGFRRGSSLKTWLYRIAVREALNHRRWLWRHHRQQASIDAEPAPGHALHGDRGREPDTIRRGRFPRSATGGPAGLARRATSFPQRRDSERSRGHGVRRGGGSAGCFRRHREISHPERAAIAARSPGASPGKYTHLAHHPVPHANGNASRQAHGMEGR